MLRQSCLEYEAQPTLIHHIISLGFAWLILWLQARSTRLNKRQEVFFVVGYIHENFFVDYLHWTSCGCGFRRTRCGRSLCLLSCLCGLRWTLRASGDARRHTNKTRRTILQPTIIGRLNMLQRYHRSCRCSKGVSSKLPEASVTLLRRRRWYGSCRVLHEYSLP